MRDLFVNANRIATSATVLVACHSFAAAPTASQPKLLYASVGGVDAIKSFDQHTVRAYGENFMIKIQ